MCRATVERASVRRVTGGVRVVFDIEEGPDPGYGLLGFGRRTDSRILEVIPSMLPTSRPHDARPFFEEVHVAGGVGDEEAAVLVVLADPQEVGEVVTVLGLAVAIDGQLVIAVDGELPAMFAGFARLPERMCVEGEPRRQCL